MNEWFADTFYFLALRNPKDAAHAQALAHTGKFGQRTLVTTAWILTEVADALASPKNRGGVPALVQLLRDAKAVIVPAEQALFERGLLLYNARPDKGWSLTDCISFVVMQDRPSPRL